MEGVELKEILRDPSQPYLYKRRLYCDDSSGVNEFFGVPGPFRGLFLLSNNPAKKAPVRSYDRAEVRIPDDHQRYREQ